MDLQIGLDHCIAIVESGELYGWGRNNHGQLGPSLPAVVTAPQQIVDLAGKKLKAVYSFASGVCNCKVFEFKVDFNNL